MKRWLIIVFLILRASTQIANAQPNYLTAASECAKKLWTPVDARVLEIVDLQMDKYFSDNPPAFLQMIGTPKSVLMEGVGIPIKLMMDYNGVLSGEQLQQIWDRFAMRMKDTLQSDEYIWDSVLFFSEDQRYFMNISPLGEILVITRTEPGRVYRANLQTFYPNWDAVVTGVDKIPADFSPDSEKMRLLSPRR